MSEQVEPVVTEIGTVLGEVRPVTRVFGDGSVDCPFCSNPILFPATACLNPWCDAFPDWKPEALQKRLDERAAKAQEEERRQASHRFAMQRISEDRAAEQAWAAEQIAEAKARGCCTHPRCLFPGSTGSKFVKHRGACPSAR